MPQFTYPGVYTSEQRGGPAPIVGVSTSTAAYIGFTPEGLTNTPIDVFDFPDYETKFGSFTAASLLPTHMFNFFQNGGSKGVVVRVVATDAVKADCFLDETATAESMTPVPAFDAVATVFTFVGANSLAKSPIVPTTVTITTSAGAGSEDFTDPAGLGVLVGDGGGSGTIDYDTGEVTLTYSAAPAGGLTLSAEYDYKTFSFALLWEGTAGNEFTVVLAGDPVFEVPATASFSRFTLDVQRTVGGVTDTVEQFSGLVLDDPTDDNYIVTVINDDVAGSRIIAVSALGNDENPTSLAGTLVSGDTNVQAPAYDAAARAFTHTWTNNVNPGSFTQTVILGHTAIQVGTGDGTDGPTIALPGAPVSVDELGIDISVPSSGAGAVENFTSDGAGTGTLTGSNGGSGTIAPTTGVITVTLFTGDTSTAAAAITALYTYPIHTITEDQNGNLTLALTVTAAAITAMPFILDPNGTNSINYGTSTVDAVASVTWKFSPNPAIGPGTNSVASVATYYTQAGATTQSCPMTDGADGSAIGRSNISAATLAGDEDGLFALNKTDELLQVAIPDFETDPIVSGDLIDYCETRQDRFAVVTVPEGLSVQEAVNYKRTTLNKSSNRAAIYYPHIKIIDPVTNKSANVPTAGHVLGIYARTDAERNVSKAPAGTTDGTIRFAIGLERSLTFNEVGELNKNNINSLLDNNTVGRVVWGGRTLENVGEFPYIQMRRLFMFVEKSVFNSTQVHVFESNTPSLRARIQAQIDSFLLGLFNTGHFSGSSPADAFYVVDKTTSANVINGIIVFEIGMAPTRPAEFIHFIFRQKTVENA